MSGDLISIISISLLYSIGGSLGACLLGTTVGFATSRLSHRARVGFVSLFLISFIMPSYFLSIGWLYFSSPNVSILRFFISSDIIRLLPHDGVSVLILLWSLKYFPITMLFYLFGERSMAKERLASSLVLSPIKNDFFGLSYILRKHVLLSGLVIILLCLTDTIIPDLVETPTLATRIFVSLAAFLDIRHSLLLSLGILSITLPIAIMATFLSSPSANNFASFETSASNHNIRKVSRFYCGFILLFITMLLVQPLLAIKDFSQTLELISRGKSELLTGFGIAFASSGIAVALSLLMIRVFNREYYRSRTYHMMILLAILPLLIPSAMFARVIAEMFSLIGMKIPQWLVWTFGLSIMSLPFAFIPLWISTWTRGSSRNMAATLIHQSSWHRFLYLTYPEIRTGIAISFILGFIVALTDINVTSILIPAGESTIPLSLYSYFHYGLYEGVASSTFWLFAGTVTVILFTVGISKWTPTWNSQA